MKPIKTGSILGITKTGTTISVTSNKSLFAMVNILELVM